MGKQKKSSNEAPKAYTIEELEQKIESANGKIQFIRRRIERIKPYLSQSQTEFNELMAKKATLEEELKSYTGFLAHVKHSLKSVFLGKENESERAKKEISEELEKLQKLIDEKAFEVKCFEESIAANEQKIVEYESDSKRWTSKLRKRRGDDGSKDPIQPGE